MHPLSEAKNIKDSMYLVYFIFYVCFLELVERERDGRDVSKPGTVPVSAPCFDTIPPIEKISRDYLPYSGSTGTISQSFTVTVAVTQIVGSPGSKSVKSSSVNSRSVI